ncbi:hypothetical protein P7F60_14930, partial [Rhizobium sp. YJ-22]|uniref:hypothetical protein n=1 Tax=Rhizobium sp. YJ-22 TaxID=3037556 RepID=UPI002412D824
SRYLCSTQTRRPRLSFFYITNLSKNRRTQNPSKISTGQSSKNTQQQKQTALAARSAPAAADERAYRTTALRQSTERRQKNEAK